LIIYIDTESSEVSKKSLVDLVSRILSSLSPCEYLKRTSLMRFHIHGFSSNAEEKNRFLEVLSKSKIDSIKEFEWTGQHTKTVAGKLMAKFVLWLSC